MMKLGKKPMVQKLAANGGETLVETLISMLIVVLSLTMLAGSIVAAARINQTAKDMHVPLLVHDVSTSNSTAVLTHSDNSMTNIAVTLYSTKGDVVYYYYEK